MRVSDHASIGSHHQSVPLEDMDSASQSGSSTCTSFEDMKPTINIPMTPEAAIGYLLSEFYNVRAFISTIPTLIESIQKRNDSKLDSLISGMDRLSNEVASIRQRGSSTAFESSSPASDSHADLGYVKIPILDENNRAAEFPYAVSPSSENPRVGLAQQPVSVTTHQPIESCHSEDLQYCRVNPSSQISPARLSSQKSISPLASAIGSIHNSVSTNQPTLLSKIPEICEPHRSPSANKQPFTMNIPTMLMSNVMTPPPMSPRTLGLSPPSEVMGFPRLGIDYPFEDDEDISAPSSPEIMSLSSKSPSSGMSARPSPFAHFDVPVQCRVVETEEAQARADTRSEVHSNNGSAESPHSPSRVLEMLSPTPHFATIVHSPALLPIRTPASPALHVASRFLQTANNTYNPRVLKKVTLDAEASSDGESSLPSPVESRLSSPGSSVRMRYCRTATPALSNFQTRQEIEEEDVGVKVEDLEKSPCSQSGSFAGKAMSPSKSNYSSRRTSPAHSLSLSIQTSPSKIVRPESPTTGPISSTSLYFTLPPPAAPTSPRSIKSPGELSTVTPLTQCSSWADSPAKSPSSDFTPQLAYSPANSTCQYRPTYGGIEVERAPTPHSLPPTLPNSPRPTLPSFASRQAISPTNSLGLSEDLTPTKNGASKKSMSSRRMQSLEQQMENLQTMLSTVLSEMASLKAANSPPSVPIFQRASPQKTAGPSPFEPSPIIPGGLQYLSPLPMDSIASPFRSSPASPHPASLGGISVPVSPPHPSQTPPMISGSSRRNSFRSPVFPREPALLFDSSPQFPSYPLKSPPAVSVNAVPVSPPILFLGVAEEPHEHSPTPFLIHPQTPPSATSPHASRPRPRLRPKRRQSIWNDGNSPSIDVTYGGGMSFEEASARTTTVHMDLPDLETASNVGSAEGIQVNLIIPPRANDVETIPVIENPIIPDVEMPTSSRPSTAIPYSPPPAPVTLDLDFDGRLDGPTEVVMNRTNTRVSPVPVPPPPVPLIPVSSPIRPTPPQESARGRTHQDNDQGVPGPSSRPTFNNTSKRKRGRAKIPPQNTGAGAWNAEGPTLNVTRPSASPGILPPRPPFARPSVSFDILPVVNPPPTTNMSGPWKFSTDSRRSTVPSEPSSLSQPHDRVFSIIPSMNPYLPTSWNTPAGSLPVINPSRLKRPRTRPRPINALSLTDTTSQPVPLGLGSYKINTDAQRSHISQPSLWPFAPVVEPCPASFSTTSTRRRRSRVADIPTSSGFTEVPSSTDGPMDPYGLYYPPGSAYSYNPRPFPIVTEPNIPGRSSPVSHLPGAWSQLGGTRNSVIGNSVYYPGQA